MSEHNTQRDSQGEEYAPEKLVSSDMHLFHLRYAHILRGIGFLYASIDRARTREVYPSAFHRFSRSEFVTTETELKAIAAAANMGLSSNWKKG